MTDTTTKDEWGTEDKNFVAVFISMQMIGGVGLLAVALTAIFCKFKRQVTWYSFCASWIVSCISYSLLVFSRGLPPASALCIIQTSLIYAAPSLTASTTLAFIVHIFLNMQTALSEISTPPSFGTIFMLLVIPYSIFLVIFLGVFAFTNENPNTAQLSLGGTYCDSNDPTWSRLSAMVVVVISLPLFVFQGLLSRKVYKTRMVLVGFNHLVAASVRAIAFGCIAIVTAGVSIVYAFLPQSRYPVFDLLLAALPVIAFLLFGTQCDILSTWMFWKYLSCSRPSHTRICSSAASYDLVDMRQNRSGEIAS